MLLQSQEDHYKPVDLIPPLRLRNKHTGLVHALFSTSGRTLLTAGGGGIFAAATPIAGPNPVLSVIAERGQGGEASLPKQKSCIQHKNTTKIQCTQTTLRIS